MVEQNMANVDWAPAVSDVGAQLRARTKDPNGNELGTFTGNTRPTDIQVSVLIGNAVNDVEDAVGLVIPEGFNDRARSVVTLGAAMLVELTYYPEQVSTGRSTYNELKALYDERLGRLTTAVAAAGDEDAEDGGLGSMAPAGGFGRGPVEYPPPANRYPIPRVDWRTQW